MLLFVKEVEENGKWVFDFVVIEILVDFSLIFGGCNKGEGMLGILGILEFKWYG